MAWHWILDLILDGRKSISARGQVMIVDDGFTGLAVVSKFALACSCSSLDQCFVMCGCLQCWQKWLYLASSDAIVHFVRKSSSVGIARCGVDLKSEENVCWAFSAHYDSWTTQEERSGLMRICMPLKSSLRFAEECSHNELREHANQNKYLDPNSANEADFITDGTGGVRQIENILDTMLNGSPCKLLDQFNLTCKFDEHGAVICGVVTEPSTAVNGRYKMGMDGILLPVNAIAVTGRCGPCGYLWAANITILEAQLETRSNTWVQL
ncbi:hypothetical protein B0H10DRAFT_1937596 [Mycena sp. CBHHK59/15]|nr:hypothetical protein B0H10DRAFT_1937596 [Mycena sp. CBHHK59/15]